MFDIILTSSILALLFGCAYSDLTCGRIPNVLNLMIFSAALIRAFFFPSFGVSINQALTSAGIIILIGFALWRFRFIGAGDIKMLAAVSALTNLSTLPNFMFLVALVAGIQAIIFSKLQTQFRIVFTKDDARGKRTMPMGVSIAISAALFVFFIDIM